VSLPYLLPRTLTTDPYGPSPLVTDLSVTNPLMFKAASERGPAPTLFATGDLPPFTASGVDPQLLTGLPYNWRHAAASSSDPALVLAWLEQCAQDHDAYGRAGDQPHPGLMDYRMRMESWVDRLVVPDLDPSEATYPDAWTANDRARAARADLAAQERAAVAEHEARVAAMRQDYEDGRRRSFLAGEQ
jgi:hypothetical protein